MRKSNNVLKLALIVWACGALLSLSIVALIIWAAIHFITKFW